MNIQQLRERYSEPVIPKCSDCGAELTVQRAGGGPTIWGCTGMIDDPTGERTWIYAEGRSFADEHYERSRWSDYRQGGDADVIELIDALEAAEKLAEFRLKSINSMDALVAGRNNRIAELESWGRAVEESMISASDRAEAAERERDELREEQAEHDEQISRMEGKFSLAKRALDSKTARCEKAEAELRRRDAATREPVAWQYRYNDGKVGDWKTVDSESECNHSPCYERRAICTAAQPAVLAIEVEELSMLIRRLVHSLKNSNPHSGLLWSVPDFMHKRGYWKENDCLRGGND